MPDLLDRDTNESQQSYAEVVVRNNFRLSGTVCTPDAQHLRDVLR